MVACLLPSKPVNSSAMNSPLCVGHRASSQKSLANKEGRSHPNLHGRFRWFPDWLCSLPSPLPIHQSVGHSSRHTFLHTSNSNRFQSIDLSDTRLSRPTNHIRGIQVPSIVGYSDVRAVRIRFLKLHLGDLPDCCQTRHSANHHNLFPQ